MTGLVCYNSPPIINGLDKLENRKIHYDKSAGLRVISLTTKKQTTKFLSAKFQKKKKIIQFISWSEFKGYCHWRVKSVDLDEVAYSEPPHQDLYCLQIWLFSALVLKELNNMTLY